MALGRIAEECVWQEVLIYIPLVNLVGIVAVWAFNYSTKGTLRAIEGLNSRMEENHSEISSKVDEVYSQMRELNGRMVKQEEWRHLHDDSDAKAFAAIDSRMNRFEKRCLDNLLGGAHESSNED
jgi:hypothetical protein